MVRLATCIGEIGLWKSGTESSTMAAFLAIEMSLNEMEEVSLTVKMVSRFTSTPSAACPRKTSLFSASSAKPAASDDPAHPT